MTRDETRGQLALAQLDKMVPPQSIFIGGGAKKLYAAEDKRAEYIQRCATEFSKVAGIKEEAFWTQAVPQALHDMLEAFDTQCSIVAAEAFLKRLGWKIERPESRI